MNLIEFLGFVATFAVMVFLSVRRTMEKRRQPPHLPEFDKEKISPNAMEAKKVLQDLNFKLKAAAQKKKQSASYKKQEPAASHTSYSHPLDKSTTPHYEVIRTEKISPGHRLLGSLQSPRDMLVIKEIFDQPLAIRPQNDRIL